MSNDTGLLREYVTKHSESAFAELVREHLNLVYSAAWRESYGDSGLAEDLAQEVFSELARKAPKLLGHPSLAGWLYTTVRLLAANARRAEQRRRKREEAANAMNDPQAQDSPEALWSRIGPVLDDALHEMKEADRIAIVLRFLEDRSLREVGVALGLQENAARMRVERALEKLRSLLATRGVSSTASGLAVGLTFGAILPAPSALAATFASTALASCGAADSSTLTLLEIMSLSKLQISLIGIVVVTGIAVPVWQQSRLRAARSELRALQSQQQEVDKLRAEVSRLEKVEADQTELERLRQWQAQTQPELLRLRGMAGVARRANEEAAQLRTQLQQQASQGGSNPVSGPMGDLMKTAMEQEASGRLARMAASLHLTSDQARAVGEVLQRQARLSGAGVQQALSGKFDQGELNKLAKEAGKPEEQIQALLTPEQQAAYKSFQQEEAARSARQNANLELLQLEGSLGLTSEQLDQVFSALYEVTFKQLNGAPAPAFTSNAEQLQSFSDQKIKALEPVLNPTQLATYRHQQESQLKFVKDLIGKMQGSERANNQ